MSKMTKNCRCKLHFWKFSISFRFCEYLMNKLIRISSSKQRFLFLTSWEILHYCQANVNQQELIHFRKGLKSKTLILLDTPNHPLNIFI